MDFGANKLFLGQFNLMTFFNEEELPIVNILDFTEKDIQDQKSIIPKEYLLDPDEKADDLDIVMEHPMSIPPPPGLEVLVT